MNKRMITGIIVGLFDLVAYFESSNTLSKMLIEGKIPQSDFNKDVNIEISILVILGFVSAIFFVSGYRDRH